MHVKRYLLILFLTFFAAAQALAGPAKFTYQGQIIKPNGQALEASTVQFTIEVLSPEPELCVLYKESHTLNMTNSNGIFSLIVGEGSKPGDGSYEDLTSLSDALDNAIGTVTPTDCVMGPSYTADSTDGRKLRVTFDDGSGPVTVAQDHNVVSVPYATSASTIGGLSAPEILRINSGTGFNLDQTNLEFVFSDSNWNELQALLDGTSTSFTAGAPTADVDNNNQKIVNLADPNPATDSDAVNVGYARSYIGGQQVDTADLGALGAGQNGEVLTWDGTQWNSQVINDVNKLPLGGGTMTGSINMGNQDITNANDISANNNISATNNLSAGQDASIGNNLTVSGGIGVTNGINSAGNINLENESELQLAEATGNGSDYVSLKSPAALAAPVNLILPDNDGDPGQYLQTDGSGVLSWQDVNAGVTQVFGRTGNVIATAGDYDADLITFDNTYGGDVDTATEVQGAIEELSAEKVAKSGDSMTGNLVMDLNGGVTTELRFQDTGTKYVGFQAPNTVNAVSSFVWTLPDDDGGAGQVLQTSGAGVLSWTSVAAESRSVTAGQGLTGGGDLSSDRTFDIGAGNGITVNADDIEVRAGNGISVDGTGVNVDVAGTADKLTSAVAADSLLIRDSEDAGNLKEITRSNFVLSQSEVGTFASNEGFLQNITGTELDTVWSGNGILVRTAPGTYSSITDNSADWDQAFAWGDHAAAGYLTAETQSLDDAYNNGSAITVDSTDVVWNLTGTNNFQVQDNGATSFIVDDNGNVGIGTTAPTSKLQIYSATSSNIALTNTGNNDVKLLVDADRTFSGAGVFSLRANNDGTRIAGIDISTGADPDNDGRISFSTASGGSNTQRMIIREDGNVGIGTSTPTAQLQVTGGVQIGDDVALCDGTKAGTLKYDAGSVSFCDGTTWEAFGTAAGGEVNDGANVGTGEGVFKSKNGLNLEFKSIGSANTKIAVSSDTDNVTLTIDENAFDPTVIPVGTTPLTATTLQAALVELEADKVSDSRAVVSGGGLVGGGDLSTDRTLAVGAGNGINVNADDIEVVGGNAITVDGSGVNVDITNETAEASVAAGDEVLIYDASAGALRKMTRSNFVLSNAEVEAIIADDGYVIDGGNAPTGSLDIGTTNAEDLTFLTNNSTVMTVDSSGNVGIGTSNPSGKLEIVDSDNASTGVGVINLDPGVNAEATIGTASDAGTLALGIASVAGGGDAYVWNLANTDLHFGTNASNRMTIQNSGLVGIGTTTPTSQLQVAGGVQIGNDAALCNGTKEGTLKYVGGAVSFCDGSTWTAFGTAAGGEVNDGANVGTGEGVFKAKNGLNLEFKSVGSANGKIAVSSDADNVILTLDESAFDPTVIPVGTTPLTATTLQAALVELEADKVSDSRSITAGNGLTGGGDLSVDRTLAVQGGDAITVDGTGVNVDITNETAEASVAAGDEILIYDASVGALRKMTRSNFVLSNAEVEAIIADDGYVIDGGNAPAGDLEIGTTNAQNLSLLTNGSTAITVDTSGNVGIGTTNPAAILDVSGTDAIVVPQGTTGERPGTGENGMLRYNTTTSKLEGYESGAWIDLVGSNSPGSVLQDTDGDTRIRLEAGPDDDDIRFDMNGSEVFQMFGYGGASDTNGVELNLRNGSSGNANRINFRHFGGGYYGAIGWNGSLINIDADTGESISFSTDGGSERMRINSVGNLGIGTTTPDEKVEIFRNFTGISDSLKLTNTSAGDSRGSGILFESGGVDSGRLASTRGANSASGDIHFYVRQSSALTELMTLIGSTGNVGIGTTSPASELDVAGIIRAEQICDESGANCQDISTGWSSGSGDFMADGSVAMTGQFDAIDGNQGNPAVSFASDANTGMFLGAADQLAFTTGGNEAVRIDATGQVGIGSQTPAGKLDVAGQLLAGGEKRAPTVNESVVIGDRPSGDNTASLALTPNATSGKGFKIDVLDDGVDNWFAVYDIDNNAHRLVVEDTGHVGINTLNPGVELDVDTGTINAASICDENNTNCIDLSAGISTGYTDGDTLLAGDGTGAAPSISFANDSNTGFFSAAPDNMGVSVNGVQRMTFNQTGIEYNNAGSFRLNSGSSEGFPSYTFNSDEDTGIYRAGADTLGFSVGGSEAMRINSSGFVGIGTNNPSWPLEIVSADTTVVLQSTSNSNYNTIEFQDELGAVAGWVGYGNDAVGVPWARDHLYLESVNSDIAIAANNNHIMEITQTGNVGIGTTAPGSLLDVAGIIRAEQICDETGANCQDISAGWSSGSGDFLADGSVPMTGALEAVYGTSASPGITFDGDEDTGITRSGSDEMALSVGGNGVMALNGSAITLFRPLFSGIWSSSTYSPSSGSLYGPDGGTATFYNTNSLDNSYGGVSLQVTNSGSTNQSAYLGVVAESTGSSPAIVLGQKTGATSYQERFRIDDSGNVGIGTTAPGSLLDVAGSIRAEQICDETGANCQDISAGWSSGSGDFLADGSVPMTGALEADFGSASFPGVAFEGDEDTGIFRPFGDSLGLSAAGTMQMYAHSGGISVLNPLLVSYPGTWGVYAPSSSSNYRPVMVGPHVQNTDNLDSAMAGLSLQARNLASDQQEAYIGAIANSSGRTPDIVIGQQTGATAYDERVRIDSSGNVGIGTTAPARLLHVDGPARITPTTLPGSPAAGDIAVDSADSNKLKFYDGSTWVDTSGGGSGGDFLADGSVPMTDSLLLADGTGASPALTFNSDQDMGFFRFAEDDLGFALNGGQVLRWNTGSFSFFNRIDAGYGAGADLDYSFTGDNDTGIHDPVANSIALTTAGSERLRVTASGNVGIGTGSPSKMLEVSGDFSAAAVEAYGDTGAGVVTSTGGSLDAYNYSYFNLANTVNANQWSINYRNGSTVGADADKLMFNYFDGSTYQDYVTLAPNGRVGIGTTAPAVALDVGTGSINASEICDENNSNCLDLSSGISGGSGDIADGGNSNGAAITIGTNDNYNFNLEANGSTVATARSDGSFLVGSANMINLGGALVRVESNPFDASGDYAHINNEMYKNGDPHSGKIIGIRNLIRGDSPNAQDQQISSYNINSNWATSLNQGIGSYNEMENLAGTVGDYTGVLSEIKVNGGTVTDAYGFRAKNSNSGTLTNAYGLYIDDLSGTNQYGVYQVGASDTNYFAGNVGIGTASPQSALEVNGAIRNSASISNGAAVTTIDFDDGNLQYTSENCQTFDLHNLKDGGTYSFAVQGTTSGTCAFNAYSDAGSTSLTVHLPSGHGATTAGEHTVYTIMVMGTHAYFAWVTAFD